MPHEHSMDARMSTTEANVEALTENVRHLAESIAEVGRNMQAGFDALREQMANRSRPQWNMYASWAGVVISVVGMVGTAVLRPMISDLARLESRMISAETLLTNRGLTIADVQREVALSQAGLKTLSERVELIGTHGSPITDKRLALLEYRMNKLKE